MSYFQIPAPIDHQLYLSIQYLITLLDAEAATARKQAATWRDLRLKYDPHQPRIPAGRSNGGEWTDGAGGNSTGRVSAPLPRRKPAAVSAPRPRRKPMTSQQIIDRARAINRHAPAGLSPRDLEILPDFGLPRWYVEGAVAPAGSPLSDAAIAVPALRGMAAGGSAMINAARHAVQVERYLENARQIPAYVRRVNADERYLPKSILKNLKDFRRSNSLRQKYVKIIGFTDRFIFQLKVPARNIPKSYAIWEKHVDMKGKTIKIYKISVGPKGELIHNKPKMR